MQKIPDFMTRNVQAVRRDESPRRAAQAMDEPDVGPLPVRDGDGLAGMTTGRDVTDRARCVASVRTARPAMARRAVAPVRRLPPILDAERRVRGIVSRGNLATLATRHQGHVAATLRRLGGPSRPDRGPN
jgi:CBS domain-containing protein